MKPLNFFPGCPLRSLRPLRWSLLLCLALALLVHAQAKQEPEKRLDLNKATAEELQKLPEIGPKLAKAIVQFREKSGPFRRVEDLLAVPGISKRRLERIRPFIFVEGTTPAKFRLALAGRGRTSDGFLSSFRVFEAEDGVSLRRTIEFRDSADDAKKELDRRVRKAKRVIAEPQVRRGTRSELRAVLELPATGNLPERMAILWTYGTELHLIECPSLQHALQFEEIALAAAP